MALALTIPLIISGIMALIRFGSRVDTILAVNKASAGLPFHLPPRPIDYTQHYDDMLKFLKSPDGTIALELHELTGAFKKVMEADKSVTIELAEVKTELDDCYNLYFEVAEIKSKKLIPGGNDSELRKRASTGPSQEMRLAYYIVESDRLSRNPALARVLLTTADTLLEVLGENASTFISNPRTASLVETLLEEFAIKHDFDDDSATQLFKKLLKAAVISTLDNPEAIPNKPAIKALFGSLNSFREKHKKDDFFNRLITEDGFQDLVSNFALNIAKDPKFITSDVVLQKVLSSVLNEFGDNLNEIMKGDSKAVFGVLEAGLAVAADNVDGILEKELSGQPILSVVLTELAGEVKKQAETNTLFRNIVKGKIFADFYKTILTAIADNPEALATQGGMNSFLVEFVTGFSKTLASTPLADTFSESTLKKIVSQSLATLAKHPELISKNNQFASKLVEAVFAASAPLVSKGFQHDDILELLEVTLITANKNLALVNIEPDVKSILTSLSGAIIQVDLSPLFTKEGRKQALIAGLQAIAVNPVVWKKLADDQNDMVKPLIEGILSGLASDPTQLLAGSVLVDAIQNSLLAISRRGEQFLSEIKGKNFNIENSLKGILISTLSKAEKEMGRNIDGENLPDFIGRVLNQFFSDPLTFGNNPNALDNILNTIIQDLN